MHFSRTVIVPVCLVASGFVSSLAAPPSDSQVRTLLSELLDKLEPYERKVESR